MDVDKFINSGSRLGLEGAELKDFVKQQIDLWKEQDRLAREQREGDQKQVQLEMEEKRLEREHEMMEKRLEHEMMEKRLEIDKEVELAKIEVEKVKVEGESNMSQSLNMSRSTGKSHVKLKMPYFDDGKDDMDAYLRRFERVVQVQEHDEREWAAHLAVLLKGKALEV